MTAQMTRISVSTFDKSYLMTVAKHQEKYRGQGHKPQLAG